MDALFSDISYGIRRLLKTGGFTSVAALTLALGIGATTAIFSVVDGLLLRPFPFKDPEGLFQVLTARPGGHLIFGLSYESFVEWQRQPDLFDVFEAYDGGSMVFAADAEAERVGSAGMTGGLMAMLGVSPILGRAIGLEDVAPGAPGVVVLSHGFWKRRFGGAPDIVGQRLRLDEGVYEVIGVMPPTFIFPLRTTQLWVPMRVTPPAPGRTARFQGLARLKPGISLAEARARADTVAGDLARTKPGRTVWTIGLSPLESSRANRTVRRALYVLFGAVVFVLLIACVNVANLQLVQAAGREREIAVRAALGAPRIRLVRQLLTESLILAVVGGTLGIVFALWSVDLIVGSAPSEMTFFNPNAIAVDRRVLIFTAAATVLTGIGFGLAPALRGSRTVAHEALKTGARALTGSRRQQRLRSGFVVAQVALSLMLLVGAGLLVRTFIHVSSVDPGFDTRQLVAVQLQLPEWKYPNSAARRTFFAQLVERMSAVPGVRGISVSGGVPPGGGGVSFGLKIRTEGRSTGIDEPELLVPSNHVDGEFFRVMGIPIRAGRAFSKEDSPTGPRTIIVNEGMARRLWGDRPAVGQRVQLWEDEPWHTVVGVAGNVYQFDHALPPDGLAIYLPNSQDKEMWTTQTVAIRTDRDPEMMIPTIRAQVWAIDPQQPIHKIRTVEALYDDFFDVPRFYALLMGIFAGIGAVLSAVGLYGVLSFAIGQRTKEFGIRLALGAHGRNVVNLVLRHGAWLALTGIVLGLLGSLVVTRALGSLLIGVRPVDPLTMSLVGVALAAIALLACWVPARRATKVDPIAALRAE